jgi:hypothetical protein
VRRERLCSAYVSGKVFSRCINKKIAEKNGKIGTKKRFIKMKDYTKKFKQEMAFFIHPKTGYVTYNKKCLRCKEDCKQSYRVELIVCKHYSTEEKT